MEYGTGEEGRNLLFGQEICQLSTEICQLNVNLMVNFFENIRTNSTFDSSTLNSLRQINYPINLVVTNLHCLQSTARRRTAKKI